MKTMCYTEEQIELLSLNELTHAPYDREMRVHVLDCDVCRRHYDHYQELQGNIIRRLKRSLPELSVPELSVQEPVESAARTEEILYFRRDLSPDGEADDSRYTVAADSAEDASAGPLRFVGVYTSGDEKYMLRALYNTETGSLHLHVVTENSSDAAGLRLELPSLGLSGITSYSGHLVIRDFGAFPGTLDMKIRRPRTRLFSVLSDNMEREASADWSIVLEDPHSSRVELGFLAGTDLNLDYLRVEQLRSAPDDRDMDIALSQEKSVRTLRGSAGTRIKVAETLETGPLCISIFSDKAG